MERFNLRKYLGKIGDRKKISFIKEQRQPCKSINCPSCGEAIKFYHYSGMGGLAPHFYCDTCSNVLFREKDRLKLRQNEPSEELLNEIAKDLPKCICGGQFRAGANTKCPHCRKEVPHQGNPVQRLTDPYVIQLEGAYLLKPRDDAS